MESAEQSDRAWLVDLTCTINVRQPFAMLPPCFACFFLRRNAHTATTEARRAQVYRKVWAIAAFKQADQAQRQAQVTA